MEMTSDIQPIPDSPQERFLKSPVREVGYGGQAGGAKSYGLILDALYQISKPGYNAILFRRTYKQLMGADGLIELSRKVYLRLSGEYLKGERIWTFRHYPGTVRFAHLEHEDDVHAYEGHQYAYVGFDELQTFTQRQYLYMFSRNRSSNPDIKPYTRSTFMPGDVGHFWVKERFIEAGIEDRPRHFRRIDGVDTEVGADDPYAVQRIFIRARLEDNPYLYRGGKGDYEKGLYQLESVDFRRKRYGDWDIRRAGRVYHTFNPTCITDYGSLDLEQATGYWHTFDFGAVNEAWGLFAKIGDVYYLIHEDLLPEGTTAARARRIKAHLTGRKVVAGFGGAPSEKQQRRDWGQEGVVIRQPPITDVESQIDRANKMFEVGTLKICSNCVLTIDQLENCVRDDKERIADKNIWHHLDVLRYFAGSVNVGRLFTVLDV